MHFLLKNKSNHFLLKNNLWGHLSTFYCSLDISEEFTCEVHHINFPSFVLMKNCRKT